MNIEDRSVRKESSATHAAYLQLRDMILTGRLPPGEKLKIDDLRHLLGFGASPIREALSLLTSDLLVERIDQRGFRAAEASKANFQELLTLRCTLEEMALRQSIARADPKWEEALVLSHHRMRKAKQAGTAAFETAHKVFHMALLAASGSAMLERLCSQLYDLNIRYRFLAASTATYQARDIDSEHSAILEAALAHDADRAADNLLAHYRRTGEYLTRCLTR